MSHYRFVPFIAFFLLPFVFFGQTDFEIEDDYILFEDAATGEPVLVYNDSMAVRGFDFKEHFKISFPDGLKPEYFTDYHYQIGDATYLVDNGCGVVLQFIDNTFKRIDNSFRHRNQYQGVPFVKDSTMYLYGGYGLFTFKNILTKYDFERKEWDRVQMKNKDVIPPSNKNFYCQTDDKLFVFAGQVEDIDNPNKSYSAQNILWNLDINSLEWQKVYKHKFYSYFKNIDNINSVNIDGKLVLLKYEINEIDFLNNKINRYYFSDFSTIKKIIYHKKSGYISYIYNTSVNKLIAKSEPYESFRGEFVSSEPFYVSKQEKFNLSTTYVFIAVFVVGIFVLFTFYIKKTKTKLKEKSILYDIKKQHFSYNGKPIEISNPYKKALLKHFMENGEHYIMLNDLNPLLQNNGTENFSTIQKRREILLKELKNEFSIILGISKDKVFSIRKNKYDKRLKEIRLEVRIQKK